MEKHTFSFDGQQWPARFTMGACRSFRRETGRDFLKISNDLSGEDLAVLLWASIKSEARVAGRDFDWSCDDFLDRVTPDEVTAWYIGTNQAEVNEDEPEVSDDSKKKTIPE